MEGNLSLNEEFSGPAVAAVLTVEMILALIANGVVLSITLYQRKSLKQPSTIFFASLILAHLVLNLLYLPFTIIALAAGEWIFGSTDEEKRGSCYFILFIFWWMVVTIFFMLTTISFERFLFIVKPHLHKRFMRPWVALTLTIAIWLLAALSNIMYLLAFHSDIDPDLCYLLPININRSSVFAIVSTVIVLVIIFITSLWTFCFTRSFFKAQSVIVGESVYASKKKRLFGIFGSMLLVYGICFVPAVVYLIIYLFIDVPVWYSFTAFICYLFITVANPVIQSYFRPEIKSFFVSHSLHHFHICC